MTENLNDAPCVKPCSITVTKLDDGTYEATYEPKIINVDENDSILSLKIVSAPEDVVIRSVTISPEDQDQLSPPTISKNGRHVTLIDINTLPATFSLNFTYGNKKGEKLAVAAENRLRGGVYPEITNDPP